MAEYSFKNELAQALQNLSGKDIDGTDYDTIGEMLHAFNTNYTCIVTFATTPEDAVVVVKQGETVIEPETDGTYNLAEGSYTYDAAAEDYTSKTGESLVVSSGDVTTGTKTVTVTLEAADG